MNRDVVPKDSIVSPSLSVENLLAPMHMTANRTLFNSLLPQSLPRKKTGLFEKSIHDSQEMILSPKSRHIHDQRSQASSKAHEIDHLGNKIPSRTGTYVDNFAKGGATTFSSMIYEKTKDMHRQGKLPNKSQAAANHGSKSTQNRPEQRRKTMNFNTNTTDESHANQQSLPQIKINNSRSRKKSQASKKGEQRDKSGKLNSARSIGDDPYENHRFFVNNKASKSVMKLIKGSYAAQTVNNNNSNTGSGSVDHHRDPRPSVGYQRQSTKNVLDMM